jgi:hypothetical protein
MRHADRLFDTIQTLRTATHPQMAAALADKLEVTVRTIYRPSPREPGANRRRAGPRLRVAPRL